MDAKNVTALVISICALAFFIDRNSQSLAGAITAFILLIVATAIAAFSVVRAK